MLMEPEHLYAALLARDSRFDGRFFVGVTSTGIYCRPVCRVRTPGKQNCRFYPHAAAAEAAGFRPCLKCRPELAPGLAAIDAEARLARAAARRIEDGALEEESLEDIADELGITDRHLRRVFQATFGVTPVQYAQTQRLLLAKRLLTDTGLSVTEIAFAAGFGSLSRFNTLFKDRYRLSPSDLRKSSDGRTGDTLTFRLAYRPPHDTASLLSFLAGRAIAGVETLTEGAYARTVAITKGEIRHTGWIKIAADQEAALTVTISASLAGVIPQILARVRHLFDLDARPDDIATGLGELAAGNPGLRLPGAFDGFEMAVRAILGQQVTVKAAHTFAGRIAAQLGEPVETPIPGLTHLFPGPKTMLETDQDVIGRLGVTRQRGIALRSLAKAMLDGELRLDPSAPVEATIERLNALPGIGPWTANYIAMRALAWPDAYLETDAGVKAARKGLKPKELLAEAEAWRPWRSYAVMHLWKSLETRNVDNSD